ncbi:MAG: cytochrome c-type biogenesis protein CcmH [Steroidobacteraceae bacterium]|jgi:cytochrome c-type biogenesis protein CcmH|nr:cytochrome c-type biogenesis protein CcmH [Steroidobacteraceae bacterium]
MRRSGRAEAARGNGAPRPDAGRLAEFGSALVAFLTALLLSLAVTLAVTGPAFAIEAERAFEDPALQKRYEDLNDELRCLVCQNQTIADSNAPLAQDLRREVREMMRAGRTDDDIRQFMTERYGDFVLYKPPMTARTYLLWSAPVILLLIALGSVAVIVLKRSRKPIEPDPEEAT